MSNAVEQDILKGNGQVLVRVNDVFKDVEKWLARGIGHQLVLLATEVQNVLSL